MTYVEEMTPISLFRNDWTDQVRYDIKIGFDNKRIGHVCYFNDPHFVNAFGNPVYVVYDNDNNLISKVTCGCLSCVLHVIREAMKDGKF